MNAFGERLRCERVRNRYTQEELGREIGKSKNNISQYEHGKREPDHATLVCLSELLLVSTDYLLGLTNYPGSGAVLDTARHIDPRRLSGCVVLLPLFHEINYLRDLLGEADGFYAACADDVSDAHYFVMEAPDNTMSEARILRGDLIFVRMQPSVNPGELAVICVGHENAKLRYIKEPSGEDLESYLLYMDKRNEDVQIIAKNDLRIIGKVTRVLFLPKKM